jgi:GDP-L-fucose synthase
MMSHINVVTGIECIISELAETLKYAIGFEGELEFDTTKDDGAPRKLMELSRLKTLGFEAKISLRDGLVNTYQWFLNNQNNFRK